MSERLLIRGSDESFAHERVQDHYASDKWLPLRDHAEAIISFEQDATTACWEIY